MVRSTYILAHDADPRKQPVRLQHTHQTRLSDLLKAHQVAHTERILEQHLVDPLEGLDFGVDYGELFFLQLEVFEGVRVLVRR